MTDNRNDVPWPDFTDATATEPSELLHTMHQTRHEFLGAFCKWVATHPPAADALMESAGTANAVRQLCAIVGGGQ